MSHISDLETVLRWEGEIDNERIRALLGIKAVWASRLMGELTAHMGDRASRASAHAPLKLAVPHTGSGSADEYLRVISHHAEAGRPSLVEDLRLDLSPTSQDIFSLLFVAAKRGWGVNIRYRSMTHPDGIDRVIYPHTLVRAPRRWHVRAWCSLREEFRDFALGRIASAEIRDVPSPARVGDDAAWNRMIDLIIVAHPTLSLKQQDVVAAEYFPGARAKRIRVRQCLAAYTIHDLRVATTPDSQQPPEYQLLLANADKLLPLFANSVKSKA